MNAAVAWLFDLGDGCAACEIETQDFMSILQCVSSSRPASDGWTVQLWEGHGRDAEAFFVRKKELS